ncbi:MAG: hypothetical protein K8F59_12050 [Rhodobacteraceae bacterium]|nr:hypothetical protein [Paracoccaceae bacterium]MCB1368674.1 hypothetical protein [Paracoccaceae bacterium]
MSAVKTVGSWVSTLRDLIAKSLLGLWIAAFVVTVLSDSIPAEYPLGMASIALLLFAIYPSRDPEITTDADQAPADRPGSASEVVV